MIKDCLCEDGFKGYCKSNLYMWFFYLILIINNWCVNLIEWFILRDY